MPLPSTPLLDDFSRPNENPLSGNGNWAQIDTAVPNNLLISSLRLTSSSGFADAYWVPLPNCSETEVFGTVVVFSTGEFRLWARLVQLGGSNQVDGYLASITSSAVSLFRETNASPVSLGTVSATNLGGDTFVLRVVAYTLTVYRIRSNDVHQVISATDTTRLSSSGKIGIGVSGQTGMSASNFGGGDLNIPLVFPAHPVSGQGAG